MTLHVIIITVLYMTQYNIYNFIIVINYTVIFLLLHFNFIVNTFVMMVTDVTSIIIIIMY